ncbi:protein C6orf206, putative [Pediculus humanus corporis]|uniref:Radial spoke head protein 9 homolog n=1 Tax=Pediculus humanus subsp. corporis TaxID=121224 RepID=E0VFB2_PEDHC|nr:protein C6orf206, putative [Pediculus humanus corporis]EEB12068.1 protein C6orf206, putative [Pediculus humanus corporis]
MAGGDPYQLLIGVFQLKEEDRLAATVELINNETVVVPRGVLLKESDGFVVMNGAYEGLSPEESDDLKSYVHYRKPVQNWNTNLLTRKDYNYALDFLDTIDLDIPKGCWSVQEQRGGKLYTLKNLYWPGFMAYHVPNTKNWGFLYAGNGRKDIDKKKKEKIKY